MEELKRLAKILNIELAVVVIFIVAMGVGVFLVFYQLTLRLDAIVTQTESSEAVWGLKDIISWQSEYEVEFRNTGKEEYAQKFWAHGDQFDRVWREARAKIILFDPQAAFFYKSNNLRDYHLEFQAVVSEIFTHVRQGTLEEAEDLIEQHEILEDKMIEIINEWKALNEKNLISLRSDANRFTNTVFWGGLLSILLISASFITISRRFFAPFIRSLVGDLTNRTKELEEAKEALEEAKVALEIKVEARTKELRKLAESLEQKVKERTKELQERIDELEKFHKLTVGRELRLIALKEEIKKLKKELEKKQ